MEQSAKIESPVKSGVPANQNSSVKWKQKWRTAISICVGVLMLFATINDWAGFQDDIAHADVGLVLGAKVEVDGLPSPGLQARLDKTVALYRARWFPLIIASGGPGKEGFDEAVVMKDYLVAHGVPAERVIADNAGLTTMASAKNTVRILRERKLSSVLVVSQYFHIPRAKLALKRAGVNVVFNAHANYFGYRDVYSSVREVPGYVVYWLRRGE